MDKPHKRLLVWQKSVALVTRVYGLTKTLPIEERYGLTTQMRRAAVSVASNIAEGAARNTKKDFANFLHNAQGSLSELDTQLDISVELGLLAQSERADLDRELLAVDRMLSGLIRSLRRSPGS